MQIPVLIQPVAGNGYLARTGEPLALEAEGATEEEALANLRRSVDEKLGPQGRMVALEVPAKPHPLAEFAGMFKDDPYFDDVVVGSPGTELEFAL